MSRTGRKKKPNRDRMDCWVKFRVTTAECKRLDKLAKRCKMTSRHIYARIMSLRDE